MSSLNKKINACLIISILVVGLNIFGIVVYWGEYASSLYKVVDFVNLAFSIVVTLGFLFVKFKPKDWLINHKKFLILLMFLSLFSSLLVALICFFAYRDLMNVAMANKIRAAQNNASTGDEEKNVSGVGANTSDDEKSRSGDSDETTPIGDKVFDEVAMKLKLLKEKFDAGAIDEATYESEKSALIDEITNTEKNKK